MDTAFTASSLKRHVALDLCRSMSYEYDGLLRSGELTDCAAILGGGTALRARIALRYPVP